MHAMTLEVAMLADVNGAYSAISNIYQRVTWPHWQEPLSLPLDVILITTIHELSRRHIARL